jgi:hypothetical protein
LSPSQLLSLSNKNIHDASAHIIAKSPSGNLELGNGHRRPRSYTQRLIRGGGAKEEEDGKTFAGEYHEESLEFTRQILVSDTARRLPVAIMYDSRRGASVATESGIRLSSRTAFDVDAVISVLQQHPSPQV